MEREVPDRAALLRALQFACKEAEAAGQFDFASALRDAEIDGSDPNIGSQWYQAAAGLLPHPLAYYREQ